MSRSVEFDFDFVREAFTAFMAKRKPYFSGASMG